MQIDLIRNLLLPRDRRVFDRLTTPQLIQDFLDKMPINFELHGETYMSPVRALRAHKAHCFEGALIAAAALLYHRKPAYLLDLKTTPKDEDHVVTLYLQNGRWGAISKTNHSILRFRDPVYASPRELAMSFFHEYILEDGSKTMRSYSKLLDMSKISPVRWISAERDLFWLVEKLDFSRHYPVASKKNLGLTRKASKIERLRISEQEWTAKGKRQR